GFLCRRRRLPFHSDRKESLPRATKVIQETQNVANSMSDFDSCSRHYVASLAGSEWTEPEAAFARRSIRAGAGFEGAAGSSEGRDHEVLVDREQGFSGNGAGLLGLCAEAIRRQQTSLRVRVPGWHPV